MLDGCVVAPDEMSDCGGADLGLVLRLAPSVVLRPVLCGTTLVMASVWWWCVGDVVPDKGAWFSRRKSCSTLVETGGK